MKHKPRVLDVDERDTMFWLDISESDVKALIRGRVPSRVRVGLAMMLASPLRTQSAVPLGSARDDDRRVVA